MGVTAAQPDSSSAAEQAPQQQHTRVRERHVIGPLLRRPNTEWMDCLLPAFYAALECFKATKAAAIPIEC